MDIEILIEISDTNIKTAETNHCKKLSGDNRDINSILVIT